MPHLRASVVLCTYNGAKYLDAQLRSYAEQTRRPDEVVVCDDRSTDNTVDVVRAYAAAAPFPVHLHVNGRNLGLNRNFPNAVSLATGDVIFLSDQDDVWLPEKVETVMAEFEGPPVETPAGPRPLGLAFSNATVVDTALQPLGLTLWDRVGMSAAHRRAIAGGRAFETFLRSNLVSGATMAFRADLRSVVCPFGQTATYDNWVASVVSAVAPCRPIERPLNLYRQHASQSVGLEAFGTAQQVAVARTLGADSYDYQAGVAADVADRLAAHRNMLLEPWYAEAARAKADFLRARAALHGAGRVGRLPGVLGQLARGRYHRFASGWKSVAKDALM